MKELDNTSRMTRGEVGGGAVEPRVNPEERAYFLSETRCQVFEQAVAIIERLAEPLILRGPPGIGKTTFLSRLAAFPWNAASTVIPVAAGEATLESLLQQLAGESSAAPETAARERLRDLARHDAKAILLIDDAGQIQAGILSALEALSPPPGTLRTVLAMTHADVYDKAASDPALFKVARILDIPALSEYDCGALIAKPPWAEHLAQAGLPMVTAELNRRLHRLTRGIPGKLFEALTPPFTALAALRAEIEADARKNQHRARRRSGIAAALGTLALIAAAGIWWSRQPPPVSSGTAPGTEQAETVQRPPAAVAETAVTSPERPTSAPAEASAEETLMPTEAETRTVTAAPAPSRVPTSQESAPPAEVRPGRILDADWVLAQKPRFYTVQLMTSPVPAPLQAFLEAHPEIEAAAIIHTRRKGRDVFKLITGVYRSRSAAAKATRELRARTVADAWPRRFDTIQREIIRSR